MKINLPKFQGKTYGQYRIEPTAWREVTDLDISKQGIAVVLSFPEQDEHKLQNINFISTFDQKYKILRKQMKLPSEILAFKLLKQAKLTNEERLLVLTSMDYNNRDQIYDQAKKSLRKFKGDQVNPISKNSETIKFDPTFLSQHEEALAAAGYIPHSKFNKSKIKQNTTLHNFNRKQSQQNRRNFNFHSERRMNPTGQNGKVLTCITCGSYRHLLNECPDSWENISKTNYIETNDGRTIENDSDREPISPVLLTGNNENNLLLLVK